MTVGERILQTAKRQGITQAMLAHKLGINQSSVSLWGKGSIPSSDKTLRIAEILNVPVDYLLGANNFHVVAIDEETGEELGKPSSEEIAAGLNKLRTLEGEKEALAAENARLRSDVATLTAAIANLNDHIALLKSGG